MDKMANPKSNLIIYFQFSCKHLLMSSLDSFELLCRLDQLDCVYLVVDLVVYLVVDLVVYLVVDLVVYRVVDLLYGGDAGETALRARRVLGPVTCVLEYIFVNF